MITHSAIEVWNFRDQI